MNTRYSHIVLDALILTIAQIGAANNAPTQDPIWYYEIGGAQVVPNPPNSQVQSIDLHASLDLSAGYSCGKFDPVTSVANTLNQVKSGADDMLKAMTDAATGAIASLPALILQRANPGLYDLMQNALVAANYKVDLATRNCRQMEAEIAQGKNPFHELVVISKGNDWKREMSFGGEDIVQASNKVDQSAGDSGVPWVFGQSAGGSKQRPIYMTADIVHVGYDLTMNSKPSTSSTVGVNNNQLSNLWKSPEEASAWVADVVGEQTVSTCDGCVKITKPGQGLLPTMQTEKDQLINELTDIIQSESPPDREQLVRLSGTNVQLTREVIEGLKDLSETDQAIYISRLSNEIALGRTLERTFYARHLLNVGKQIPEVLTNSPAKEHVESAISSLDSATDRLLVEYRIRQLLSAGTASQILQRSYARRNESRGIPEVGPIDRFPIQDGRVTR